MDQQSVRDLASQTAEKAGQAVKDAAQQAGTSMQGTLDRGKAMMRDAQAGAITLAQQASETGRQAMSQAGGVVQDAAREAGNQATRAAANLYEQGSQAGDYITRYTAEQPVTALLVAGAIGYALAYLIHHR